MAAPNLPTSTVIAIRNSDVPDADWSGGCNPSKQAVVGIATGQDPGSQWSTETVPLSNSAFGGVPNAPVPAGNQLAVADGDVVVGYVGLAVADAAAAPTEVFETTLALVNYTDADISIGDLAFGIDLL